MIKRRYLFYIAGLVIILILAVSAYYLAIQLQPIVPEIEIIPATQAPTIIPDTPIPADITSTKIPVATLPPPLANIEFPMQIINYPPDWPDELHYPQSFTLVEASSSKHPDTGSIGYNSKLRFDGDPISAADLLSTFFISQGWQILDRTEEKSVGVIVIVGKNNLENQGVLIISPDTTNVSYTNVLANVSP